MPSPAPAMDSTRNAHHDGVPWPDYLVRVPEPHESVPVADVHGHTMAGDLDTYVTQRLPVRPLTRLLQAAPGVEVHGVYPTHFPAVASQLGYTRISPVSPLRQQGKPLNAVRPRLFSGRDHEGRLCALLAVPPGRDYVLHYASLVRHFVGRNPTTTGQPVDVWRYPEAEQRIARWTGLDGHFVRPGDTVVLGNVEHCAAEFDRLGIAADTEPANGYYTGRRYRLPGGRATVLLGSHFSYWGSISTHIATRCCELGAREILYVGKLGALSSPIDLYTRLFVPSQYAVFHRLLLVATADGLPNGVLERFPGLDSGLHVSVPTVLEEDYHQRSAVGGLGATTIDNELSQIAVAIDQWNTQHRQAIRFSAVHYATDYLRPRSEARRRIPYSLCTGRSGACRDSRRDAMRMISDCLHDYLVS
ncbi:MAG: hypothetical protein ACQSGP_26715 [Frankia sp.]